MQRLYFDHAATSFPKPQDVVDAISRYLTENGVAAGRGSYRQAHQVMQAITRCREAVARWCQADSSRHVIFTANGTDSLNLALQGLCRSGDHVIATTWEHNSVLRPLRALRDRQQLDVSWIEPDDTGRVRPADIEQALRPNTRLVAVQHANNVTGVVQPIEEIGPLVRRHGAAFLVDAAQSAGYLPINMASRQIDLLACPAHKGLLGPLGLGLLVVGERVENELVATRFGGTGTRSEEETQPDSWPEKLESGNLNVPAILGQLAAFDWWQRQDREAIAEQESRQTQRFWDGLSVIPGVTLHGAAPSLVQRTGVISLQIAGYSPHDAATILDEHFGIQCRAGLHCAPGVHRSLGTLQAGGTLRLSLGATTTDDEIEAVITAIETLARS